MTPRKPGGRCRGRRARKATATTTLTLGKVTLRRFRAVSGMMEYMLGFPADDAALPPTCRLTNDDALALMAEYVDQDIRRDKDAFRQRLVAARMGMQAARSAEALFEGGGSR